MKPTAKILIAITTTFSISLLSNTSAMAASGQTNQVAAQQILLDTGNNGGSESVGLPAVKIIVKSTPGGNFFMFWTWSAR